MMLKLVLYHWQIALLGLSNIPGFPALIDHAFSMMLYNVGDFLSIIPGFPALIGHAFSMMLYNVGDFQPGE